MQNKVLTAWVITGEYILQTFCPLEVGNFDKLRKNGLTSSEGMEVESREAGLAGSDQKI